MKNRLLIFFIVLLIGLNFVLNGFNDDFKAFLQNKFVCAMEYYADKARFYYGRLTGRIPSEVIMKNPREWSRFEIVCDALLLDSSLSEELFAFYIESRDESFDEMRKAFDEKREERRSAPRPPGRNEPGRRPPVQRWEETAVARFEEKLEGRLSPNEWEISSSVLNRFWGFSPIVELRALRKIQLSDLQRSRLQPYSIALVETQKDDGNDYDFDAIAFDNQMDFQLAQSEFVEKVHQILTSDQLEEWETMKTQVQESLNNDPRRRDWKNRRDRPARPRPQWSMASIGS